ncbi:hypothetical protein BU26DRAFT_514979 [Trematosphaeria pertusa]|uniref:DUF7730 domain-containing protein n=1 Tax=Trematosphaeria pertusa TaxID=390896 RepID=A0A6A6IY45_9PLEO|nr:uncharacterized protein BU26DRAFT_514979 [Trematosphaeria pertusa]KAF2255228.1 hypothetical protein BU26DRAFT_514979 [Trematosphaeria pertusa]
MEGGGSLFSRIRPAKRTPKKIRGFLSLPGELRNLVYRYYFLEEFRCEIAAKGCDFTYREPKLMKLCVGIVNPDGPAWRYKEKAKPASPTTLRISRPLGNCKHIDGLKTSWFNSLCALMLVCKQIHREAIVFLYHTTTFVFNAPNRITNFLDAVPTKNLSYVTKLHLHYGTYGHPSFLADQIWKKKHVASWTRACKAAAKKLINLQELEIWMRVNDSTLYFDLRQEWVQPLLQFRRLARTRKSMSVADTTTSFASEDHKVPKSLKAAKIHFRTYWSDCCGLCNNPNLADASLDLHHLFAKAIGRAILGASEEEAMAEFKEAWEGKYEQWKHYLRFYKTGW